MHHFIQCTGMEVKLHAFLFSSTNTAQLPSVVILQERICASQIRSGQGCSVSLRTATTTPLTACTSATWTHFHLSGLLTSVWIKWCTISQTESSVGSVTSPQTGRPKNHGSIHYGSNRFLYLLHSTQPSVQWVLEGSFPRDKVGGA